MYEDCINDSFAVVAHKVLGDKFQDLDPERLSEFKNLNELIEYVE